MASNSGMGKKSSLKTLAEIEQEVLEQRKLSEQNAKVNLGENHFKVFNERSYKNNQRIRIENTTRLDSDLASTFVEDKIKKERYIKKGFDTNKIVKYEAVLNRGSNGFTLVATDKNNVHIYLDKNMSFEDLNELKGSSNEFQVSNRKGSYVFKGRLDSFLEENVYKGRISGRVGRVFRNIGNGISKGLRKIGSSIRNSRVFNPVRRMFSTRIGKMSRRITSRLSKGLGKGIKSVLKIPNALDKMMSNLFKQGMKAIGNMLKAILNFIVGIATNPVTGPIFWGIIVVIIVIANWGYGNYDTSIVKANSPEYTAEDVLNQKYEIWGGVAESLSKEFGAYFNFTDGLSVTMTMDPTYFSLDTADYKAIRSGFDEKTYAKNMMLLFLDKIEKRTEYFHWTWGNWQTGFDKKPTGFDLIREYTVNIKTWVPATTATKYSCIWADFGFSYDISATQLCPWGFEKVSSQVTVDGYYIDSNKTYWDGRNILSSYWDTKSVDVANINTIKTPSTITVSGVSANVSYTSYWTKPDDQFNYVKDCDIKFIYEPNGDVTRSVEYWTLKEWETVISSIGEVAPVGKDFLSVFSETKYQQVVNNFLDLDNLTNLNKTEITNLWNTFVNKEDSEFVDQTNNSNISSYDLYYDYLTSSGYVILSLGFTDSMKVLLTENFNANREVLSAYFGSYGLPVTLMNLFTFPLDISTDSDAYIPVTSHFGMRYLEGNWGFHYGVDFGTGAGTSALAVADNGIVVDTYNMCPTNSATGYGDSCGEGGGNLVTIKYSLTDYDGNAFDLYMSYNHLAKDTISVKKGDVVHGRQVIAKTGNSGSSTGAHLHFAIFSYDAQGTKIFYNPEFMFTDYADGYIEVGSGY
jgi:murein DD-endopeptidase MepM/ murein hydrolase activator NlpD